MTFFEKIKLDLQNSPKNWLVTGVAGFIGSNLLETLLLLNQKVVGLDNFATSQQRNLDEVNKTISTRQRSNFTFVEGDIRNLETCSQVTKGVDYVLHQAALGSVPRSIQDPITTNDVNIGGFLNILVAANDQRIKSFVYAASSSTYGDHTALPKVEDKIGAPLSPYAVTKYANEMYADVFEKSYGFKSVGLRYFNVYGPRQDPSGAYAAVIPSWASAMINDEDVFINGDGKTSRDFCYVDDAVQANILAATTQDATQSEVYNVAVNDRTSLNDLFLTLQSELTLNGIFYNKKPQYREFRPGDVRHSQADISKAGTLLKYKPRFRIDEGIKLAMPWYIRSAQNS